MRCTIDTEESRDAWTISMHYGCGSRDGLQGRVLGTEEAGVQTHTWYSRHDGVHLVSYCKRISFLVRLFVFPGVDSCLTFLFVLFSVYSPLALPQTLQQYYETPHGAACRS